MEKSPVRFESPLLLLLFIPLAGLAFELLRRERTLQSEAKRLPSAYWASGTTPSRFFQLRDWELRLVLGSLALVVVALAQPQWGLQEEHRVTPSMDIVFALDLSRSMETKDVAPSRLTRAKVEIQRILKAVPSDRIGLVGFTADALPLCPLTIDHSSFLRQLREAEPKNFPNGGTSLAEAVKLSLKLLKPAATGPKTQAIVLLTDGEDHEGSLESVVETARNQRVPIHIIGLGTTSGGRLSIGKTTVTSRLNIPGLKKIHQLGPGVLSYSSDGRLDTSPVRRALQEAERAKGTEQVIQISSEQFQWPLGFAILALILSSFSSFRRSGILASVLLLPSLSFASLPENEAVDAYHQGLRAAMKNEPDQALHHLREARNHSSHPELLGRSHFAEGNLHRKSSRYEEAMKSYQQAYRFAPKLSGLKKNLEITQRLKQLQKEQKQPDSSNSHKQQDSEDSKKEPSQDSDEGEKQEGTDSGRGDSKETASQPGANNEEGKGETEDSEQGNAIQAPPEPGKPSPSTQAPQSKQRRSSDDLILDGLEAEEKAFGRGRLQKVKRRKVKKNW